MSKISSSVDESAKSATLLKDSRTRDSRGGQRRRKRLYLERLTFTQVVPDYAGFTHEQLAKLISMAPDEQIWRNSFFDSLIHEGLLIELQKLPTEELREFVFMQKEEQGKWRKKLTERKAQRDQQHERDPQEQPTQQDKILARMHKPHRDEFLSMEIRFLPEVRKMVDYLAASKGMAGAECVESIVVDAINNNHHLIEEGDGLLKKFRTLPRIKRHVQEEKLARQEERLAHLEAIHAGNSTRNR